MKFSFASLIMMVPALVITAFPAAAQDAPAPAPQTKSAAIEVTPFVSIGSLGSAPIGAAINFPVAPNVSIETEVGFRRGEGRLNFLSSSANLLYYLPRVGRTTPYLAAGAGLGQFGAPIVAPGGSVIGTERLVGLSVNAGGGLKVAVDDTWGMRTDARWFKSFGRNASEYWRVAQGVSFDVGKR
jgi:hypothetical protein